MDLIITFLQQYPIVEKSLFAILYGFVIGFDRACHKKPAGIRTTILVVLGATIFASISQIMSKDFVQYGWDGTRIASNVVTGIGFLGAGVILHKQRVIGITTAATMWVCAAIGMMIAVDRTVEAGIVTILVFFILSVLGRIEKKYTKGHSLEEEEEND